jgi:hypothetical protein
MPRLALILIAAAAGLAAWPAEARTLFDKSRVYLSLMGEPFRVNASGQDPFDQWFTLADRDGDGGVSRVELRADAEAFFGLLDTNDDKVIDGDEMAQYEQLAPGRTRAAGGGAPTASSARPTPKSSAPVESGQVAIVSSGKVPSATRIHVADTSVNFSEVPQPVAMADLNLDRRVTLEEFLKTAGRRFTNYDVDQDGKLTRKELR